MMVQCSRVNFDLHTHRVNPWVYAHSVQKVRELEHAVLKIRDLQPDLKVRVVVDGNVWPIPFYLRNAGQITYLQESPRDDLAHVMIVEARLARVIRDEVAQSYQLENYYGVRHDLTIALYVHRNVWKKLDRDRPSHPGIARPSRTD
jgi:ribosomal protein S13